MPGYLGHVLSENRNGLVVAAMATHAGQARAEREAALVLLDRVRHRPEAITLGADKSYQEERFIQQLQASGA